jgi:hypothetical protein
MSRCLVPRRRGRAAPAHRRRVSLHLDLRVSQIEDTLANIQSHAPHPKPQRDPRHSPASSASFSASLYRPDSPRHRSQTTYHSTDPQPLHSRANSLIRAALTRIPTFLIIFTTTFYTRCVCVTRVCSVYICCEHVLVLADSNVSSRPSARARACRVYSTCRLIFPVSPSVFCL